MLSLSLEEQIAGSCVHFTGIQNKTCKAGIAYASFEARGFAKPCFNRTPEQACASCHFPTPEEVAAEVAAHEASYKRMELALTAVDTDRKAKGLRKGHGGGSSLPCPVCGTGTLGYSVAGCNGHIHGCCSTEGCVRWMQ